MRDRRSEIDGPQWDRRRVGIVGVYAVVLRCDKNHVVNPLSLDRYALFVERLRGDLSIDRQREQLSECRRLDCGRRKYGFAEVRVGAPEVIAPGKNILCSRGGETQNYERDTAVFLNSNSNLLF